MRRKGAASPRGDGPGDAASLEPGSAATAQWFIRRDDGVDVRVRVVPRASRQRIAGTLGDRIKVQIHAAPVEGEANRALVTLLAGVAGLPSSAASVVAGSTNRSKTVRLMCADPALVLLRLHTAVAETSVPGSQR